MNNTIAIIREKLDLYNKPFIQKDFIVKILDKFAPNYTISMLCDKGLLTPIKRGKWYINNKTRDNINPFIIGDLYMGDELYMFGGMALYNRYGFSEQIAEWNTIYNTTISGKKIIGQAKFIFIRQRKGFFCGKIENKIGEYKYNVMSKERAFIELLKENKTFKEIPYGVDKNKLQKLAIKYASKIINIKINKLCI